MNIITAIAIFPKGCGSGYGKAQYKYGLHLGSGGRLDKHVRVFSLIMLRMLCLYLLTTIVYILRFNHIFSSESYSRNHKKLSNIVIHAISNIAENDFVKKVWPANLALFVYLLTFYFETY